MRTSTPPALRPSSQAPGWDIFCRVIDNHGDTGVCWRRAAAVAARAHAVRLWVDDASALGWMAPRGAPGVAVHAWPPQGGPVDWPGPAEVVVEAFGCDLPDAFLHRMATRRPNPPCWINLEYLSAEDYVERCHRLPSPQLSGPGQGLAKFFFYPGFTGSTGGLLREPGLTGLQAEFDAGAWLAARGWQRAPGERLVSVFAYANPGFPELLRRLAGQPTCVLAAPGPSGRAVAEFMAAEGARHPGLRFHPLPYLEQPDYDRLLWSCDLNLVRGEDSFVRAQWAAAPFLWQIYPQDDGAHAPKLRAFLGRFLAGAAPSLAGPVAAWHEWWAGLRDAPPAAWPEPAAWAGQCARWRQALAGQDDLATQLIRFVSEQR